MELTVISFNIRNMRAKDGLDNWEHRRDLLCEVLRRHRPDLLATQEAFLPQIEYMRQTLPEYADVAMGRDDGKTEGEHCAVFFLRDRFHALDSGTFWFSDTPETPGSRQWTPNHARICTWVRLRAGTGQAFTVYNVHLDHESQPAREQSVRLIQERIRQTTPDPVLIMGDFNMEEDNSAYRSMLDDASGFHDTYRVLHPQMEGQGTFHGFTGRKDGEHIDYIFASPDFDVLDAKILYDQANGRYPSDHFPILARLRLED